MERIEEKNIRPERSRPELFAASGFYLLAAVGLWAAGLLGPAIASLLPGASVETQNFAVTLLYYGGFIFVPIALWASRKEDMMEGMRLNPIPPGTMLRTILVAILCVLIIYDFSVFWMALWQKLGLNVFADPYVRPADKGELMLSVISTAFITVVCEELLFRGVLLSAWERGGTKSAALTTAVLFAMLHGSLLGLPGEIFGGFVLAMLVVRTDSLYTGMIFHSVYNALLVVMSYLSSSSATEEAAEAAMQTSIIAGLGGWGAVLPLALEMVFMTFLVFGLLRGFTVRAKWFGIPECPEQPVEISTGTTVLILAGAVSTIALYALDFMTMLGG